MATEKFVILKKPAATRGGFESGGPDAAIKVEEMTPREASDLLRDKRIAAVAPNMPLALIAPRPAATPATPQQVTWGVDAVGATASPFDGASITVAVLDTGIDARHAAFKGVTITQADFVGEGDGDPNGHGTHCAGTILGRDIETTRIGVARGVTNLLAGKVIGSCGGGGSGALFTAMQWAVMSGARVISMSLGFDFPGMVQGLTTQCWPADLATSRALEAYRGNLRMFDAIMAMVAAQEELTGGVVVVAASGNESRREVHPDYEIAASLPAAANGVVSVGAVEPADGGFAIATFSNSLPEVCAPGVGVLSAAANTPAGLVALSGTSMACPHVAGLAALWWQSLALKGQPKAKMVVSNLRSTARRNQFAASLNAGQYGAGFVTAPRE